MYQENCQFTQPIIVNCQSFERFKDMFEIEYVTGQPFVDRVENL